MQEFILQLFFTILTSAIMNVIIWYWKFKKIPEDIKNNVELKNIELENRIMNQFGKNGNLSNEHTNLSNEHDVLLKHTEALYVDYLVKKDFNEKTEDSVKKLENTISKLQNDEKRIKELKHDLEVQMIKNKELEEELLIVKEKIKQNYNIKM